MAINRVDFGGKTLIDLTGDTLESADQLLKGIIAHAKDGSQIVGALEAGGGSGLEIANYYVFGGSFTPAEDVSNKLELATDESLGLPSGYIYQKRNFLFGAIWSIGGYLEGSNYINAAMSAPKSKINVDGLSNSLTGAVLKGVNTVSRSVIMFNGTYPSLVDVTCDASYMLKAGVKYAWAAFIPKR